jgi:hypothetical protein
MLAARAWEKCCGSASLVPLPHSSKPGVPFFSALAQWRREHGLGGGGENSKWIEQDQRASSYPRTPCHVQCRSSQVAAGDADVAEGFHAELISGNDRLIERKDEQLREAETPVPAKDRQVRQAESQKTGLRSALDQAEAELARINSSRPWRLVTRLSRLRGLAAG